MQGENNMEYNEAYVGRSETKMFLSKRKVYRKDYKLQASEYEGAYILPRKQIGEIPYCGRGGVLDSNWTYAEPSADYDIYHKEREGLEFFEYKFGGGYQVEDYVKCEDTVIYGGLCHIHWGHFLMDIVQRLWYLLEDDCQLPICFSAWENNPDNKWSGNFLEFLELFGIKRDRIRIVYEPTKFKKVIVPAQAIYPGEYYHPKYIEIFDRVTKAAMCKETAIKSFPEKIYLSRQKLKAASKKEVGEAQIEKEFLRNGFTSLYFERLSVVEQIQYLNCCKEVAAISGTLTHNLLFCQNPVHLIYLNKSSIPLHFQMMVNEIRDLKVTWIDVYQEPFQNFPTSIGYGPFYLKATDEFKRFWRERGHQCKRNGLLNYVRYCGMCIVSTMKIVKRGWHKMIKGMKNI